MSLLLGTSGCLMAKRVRKIPIRLGVRLSGYDPAIRSIGGATQRFRKHSKEAVRLGAKGFRKHQARLAPVGERGSIPPSLRTYVRPFRGGWRGVSYTNYNVAMFTSEGTGMRGGYRPDKYPVPVDYDGPLNKMVSYRSKRTGEMVWVGRHPGIKGTKWFLKGFEAGIPEAERRFTSAVRRSFTR